MTPHAQEPTPVHSNRIGLHGQRGAPGRVVFYASHTVVAWSGDGMTPHAQEPTPLHSNRIGLHGQRGAPGRGVFYASHTEVLDGSLFEKEQGGHTFGHGPHVRRV